jgi:hypothetical protein
MKCIKTPFVELLEEVIKLGGREMAVEWSREEWDNLRELRTFEAEQQKSQELQEANSRQMFFVRRS